MIQKLLKMPQHKWNGTIRKVRTNGLLVWATVVLAAIVTRALLVDAARYASAGNLAPDALEMRVLLMAATIATGVTLLAFEIFGFRREYAKSKINT